MTSQNIKDWGMSGKTAQTGKRSTSAQWIQSSNPYTRLQTLSAFKSWYFQQQKNSQ